MDSDLIRRLETLAGLACYPAEREALARDLREMVGFVDRLADYVSDWTPPPGDGESRPLRVDVRHASLTREEALSGAPAVEDGCFLTPPVSREEPDDA